MSSYVPEFHLEYVTRTDDVKSIPAKRCNAIEEARKDDNVDFFGWDHTNEEGAHCTQQDGGGCGVHDGEGEDGETEIEHFTEAYEGFNYWGGVRSSPLEAMIIIL